MPRYVKVILWASLGTVAAFGLCLVVLTQYDWNRAKPWLNARVSEASGRTFAMNGNLSVAWHRSLAEESGWQRWIPWPRISAHDVVLGNPEWAKSAPNMAEVGHVTFSLNPLALLDKQIVVQNLLLEEPLLFLERAKDRKNNWTFQSDEQSDWKFELRQVGFAKGEVHLVDAITHADLVANIDTIDRDDDTETAVASNGTKQAKTESGNGNNLAWKIAGRLDKEVVSGNGQAGDILALQELSTPYPIKADVRVGKTRIAINGTLTNPRSLAALDVRLKLAGVSMARLYALTGIPFPETPAYATEGRLLGKLGKGSSKWKYEKFSGKVGSSDLAGTFEYQSKQPRPYLNGTLISNVLALKDLAPLIGADSKASKAQREASKAQPAGKILPVEPFETERWTSIDADVTFTGRKIVLDQQLPVENLSTTLKLKDGVLSLQPLDFGFAGGDLLSTIVLDGRGPQIQAKIKLSARHMKLKQLFPTVELMKTSEGEVNGDALLSATGNSVAAILGSSNGEIKAFVNGGTISKLLLEEIGLNIGSVVLTQIIGDKQVKLNCVASDFTVTKGLMQTRSFVVDTEEAVLNITGKIDLATEQLDLTIKPDTKTLRVISLQAPLYVTGSFKSPKVRVDRGVLALKTGAAVALGVLAPVLTAVIPLVNLGPGKQSDCARLLGAARTNPVAPPPGKLYRGKAVANSMPQ